MLALVASLLCFIHGAALAANEGHEAPAPTLERPPATSERQAILSELWQRKILPAENDRWTAADLALLERVREAERAGAITDLRRRYGGLKGLAVAVGRGGALRLTREGHAKWLFLRSQQAIEYFSSKEVDPKWAFQLTDLEGRKLFDSNGLLTPAGDALYARVRLGLAAHWQTPDGQVRGNRRAPPAKPKLDPLSLPVTIGPEHPALVDKIRRAYGAGYEPVMRGAELGRLTVVIEHDPAGSQGGYLVIVARAKDKAAARAEFVKRLPDRGVPPDEAILTVEEKLAKMEANLEHLEEQTGEKGGWTIDRKAVEAELRKLLKGKLALVWALAGPPPAEPPPQAPPAPEPEPVAAPAPAGAPAPAPPAPAPPQ